MKLISRCVFLLILVTAGWPYVHAQKATPTEIYRLRQPIKFDGYVDDEAWKRIDPLPLVQYKPVYKGEITELSEIRIAYDDTYIYVSGRLYTHDPGNIRTNTLYRDQYSGDDLLAVILDTYHDHENALFFHTNPSGVRVDIELSNDAEGNFLDIANFDWNTYWDVKTSQNEMGWFAEMRIPFSSLGFQAEGDKVVMGLIVYRYLAHNNQVQVYPDISPEHYFYQPSMAKDIQFQGIEHHTPAYVSPYLLGSLEQLAQLNEDNTGYRVRDELYGDPGLDIKYNITNNLTLDLTVNTDFAQVEADAQQVNLSRFSLFFPEKRQFFQERASIFSFKLGFRERLFHSRRIGLSDNGEPIPILGGFRLVGRIKEWDIGILNMQTATQGNIPTENFGVARFRKRVLNGYSYVGGMMTSRYDKIGNYNVAYGIDGNFRVVGDEYVTVQWSQTFDSDTEHMDFLDSVLGRFRWERRKQEGFSYFADVTWAGSGYNPETGFLLRRDFFKNAGQLTFRLMPKSSSSIRFIEPSVPWQIVIRNGDGQVESIFTANQWVVEWKSGATASFATEFFYEDLLEPLLLPENSFVPVGEYNFIQLRASYGMPLSNLFRVNTGLGYGGFFDGKNYEISVSPTWNFNRFLELSGSYQLNYIRFMNRSRAFATHIFQFQLNTTFNTQISIRPFIQFNSTEDLITSNIRFRYNFREGNDLWIVYNESLNSRIGHRSPKLPVSNGRTILVKYKHTFRW